MADKAPKKEELHPKEEAEKTEKKEAILPDPSIEAMTRDEAMAYFDLPAWAKREELDNQFWKLGKIYKAQKDEQKLADLAAAYNIANGNRDREAAKKKEEEQAKHYFGKTKKQWGEFWHYEWWKFAVAIAVIIFLSTAIKFFFLDPKVDLRVASVGHFTQDANILESYFKTEYKYKNPDISYANLVSENTEGEEVDPYATQLAVSLIAVKPDILVFDELAAPVYVNSQNLLPLDDLYEQMKNTWSEEELSHIEPYIYSRAQFYEDYSESLKRMYEDELDALTDEDYVEHVYGFIIKDRVDCLSLGYTVHWKENQAIIVGVNYASGQVDKAKELTESLLKAIPSFREKYLEDHPFADSDD